MLFVPYNGKIADITHADTVHHYLDLGAALSATRKTIMVILSNTRIAGTGGLNVYPNEGVSSFTLTSTRTGTGDVAIKNGTQRLDYALNVAGDDFDLYCFGYVVEA